MDAYSALSLVMLGALLGAIGQSARAVVGLKKEYDQASASPTPGGGFKDRFNANELIISLLIGAVAGGLASLLLLGKPIGREIMLSLVAAGYAGTDFIEGFMKTNLPK